MKRISAFLLTFFVALLGWAGSGSAPPLWPLEGGGPLTSSFCEARINRLHLGWDVSIEGQIGLPVRAPRAAKISRMKLEWRGYGRAIYLDHGDGWVTVFAHLDRFEETTLGLESLAKKSMKAGNPFPGNIFPKPQIKVTGGQVIGYAGGGGVGQPHLHMETRFHGVPTDPSKFGFVPPNPGASTLEPMALWLIPKAQDPRSGMPGQTQKLDLKKVGNGTWHLAGKPTWTLPAPDLVLEVGDRLPTGSFRGLKRIQGSLGSQSMGTFAPESCRFDQRHLGRTLFHQGLTSGGHFGIRLPLAGGLKAIPGITSGQVLPDLPGRFALDLNIQSLSGKTEKIMGQLEFLSAKPPPPPTQAKFWTKGTSLTAGPTKLSGRSLAQNSWVWVHQIQATPSGTPLKPGSPVWEVGPNSLIFDQGITLTLPLPKGETASGWSIYRLYNDKDWLPLKSTSTQGAIRAKLSSTGQYTLLKDRIAPLLGNPDIRVLQLPRRIEALFPIQEKGLGMAWNGVQVQWKNQPNPPLVIFDPDENQGHGAGVADITAIPKGTLEGRFRARDKAGNISAWQNFSLELIKH